LAIDILEGGRYYFFLMENSANSTLRTSRELGLAAAESNNWTEALLYLNWAARKGHVDLVTLDALGEAAYKANVPEALGPYQNHYKYPMLATHMARAFLMLGDPTSCKEFLGYAKDSALKSAIRSLLELGGDIKKTASFVLPVAEAYPQLYYPEYWRALAAVADAVGREDLTKLSERKSKAFAYSDANIHFNQALRMLGKGEFRAGWRLYEFRLVPNATQSNRTQLGLIPMWEGESLQGKRLIVYLEQGLGDGLFSLRYLQALEAEGATLEVVTRPPLIPLVRSSFPDLKIHNEDEAVVVGYWESIKGPDYWVYGLSVPFRAGLWRPMFTQKYLAAPENLAKAFQERVRLLNPLQLPVYTVNWHGRIDTDSDRTRAFSVEEFAQVTGIDQKACIVICLQKDATAQELASLERIVTKKGGVFIDASPELSDFSVTAAWIVTSQRLLTCDTSVAHVGGALGHPTTVFARNKAIWQWLRVKGTEDQVASSSVWYDSVQVQYALAPEISWLFTTTTPAKENSNEHAESPTATAQLPPSNLQPAGQQRKFRFAGRPEQP
jgi:hypothetical protein